jgi:hypothetical protein
MQLNRHYLISAWSSDSDASERARAEHELLSEVVAVLANTPVLIPRAVYPPGTLPTTFPDELADEAMPVTVVPPDGFPKLAEFWGTMPGSTHAWKPVVYLILTVPVFLDAVFAGAEVTTVTTDYRVNGESRGAETLVQIGGVVRDHHAKPVEVPDAWVALLDEHRVRLQATSTNATGEFVFADISPGSYHLEARAVGYADPAKDDITVPSPSGRYDLAFA